jgi:hypothetical protein
MYGYKGKCKGKGKTSFITSADKNSLTFSLNVSWGWVWLKNPAVHRFLEQPLSFSHLLFLRFASLCVCCLLHPPLTQPALAASFPDVKPDWRSSVRRWSTSSADMFDRARPSSEFNLSREFHEQIPEDEVKSQTLRIYRSGYIWGDPAPAVLVSVGIFLRKTDAGATP